MEKTGTGNIAASHPLYESKGPHYSPIGGDMPYPDRLMHNMMLAEEHAKKKVLPPKTDDRATWMLADYFLPTDVKEFFERHGMLATGSEIWRTAFVTGFKVSLRGSIKDKE